MNNNTTDSQVAKDLINLTRVINEAIGRGESVYEKIRNLDETKVLIQEINDARKSLNKAEEKLEAKQSEIQKLENSTFQHLVDARQILDELEQLKDLPSRFSELGLDQSLLIRIQNSLSDLKSLEKLIGESKDELRNSSIQIENQLEEFHEILQDAASKNEGEATKLVLSLDTKSQTIRSDIQAELEKALSQIQIKSHSSSTQSSAVLFDINKNFQDSLNLYRNIENQKIVFQRLMSDYEQEVSAIKQELVNYLEQQATENKSNIERTKKIFEAHEKTVSKFSEVLDKAGGTNAVEDIIKQMQISKEQLDEAYDRLASIRSFEGYLQEFKFTKNRKFFGKMLWREFGFVGIIVYLLSLFPQHRK